MKTKITLLFLLFSTLLFAQITISGKAVAIKIKPIQGANVFIEDTYDGANSNEKGEFSFLTSEKASKILMITYLTSETSKTQIIVENYQFTTFILKESLNTLDTVVNSSQ
jgi:hypothetical protein